ncbi:MAG: class I SAM-dependent methyltransferase [Thermoguttaceae bacterium]|nr:class I SAM-dependent methyltransferase [Thermoguttaceae bacterium]
MSETPNTLAETLQKYDIALSPGKIRRLEAYALELWQWNTKLNLTRHNDWDKFVARDLIDSIRLAACLQKGESVLDVGTGGGVPGVLLTILRPDLRVDLCDSTGKKTVALGAILDAVGLKNNLWHAKGEELLRVRRYHTLVIRAVSKMDRLLTMFAPCWQAFDRLLMIKGPSWVEERKLSQHLGLLTNLALRKIDEYTVPGDEHSSVILQICHKNRYEEIRQREEDLAAGKPIDPIPELLAIDNKIRRPAKDRAPRAKDKPAATRRGDKPAAGRGQKSGARRRGPDEENQKHGKGWVHPDTPFTRPKTDPKTIVRGKNAAPAKKRSAPGGSSAKKRKDEQ